MLIQCFVLKKKTFQVERKPGRLIPYAGSKAYPPWAGKHGRLFRQSANLRSNKLQRSVKRVAPRVRGRAETALKKLSGLEILEIRNCLSREREAITREIRN